jgi:hypothetical protein
MNNKLSIIGTLVAVFGLGVGAGSFSAASAAPTQVHSLHFEVHFSDTWLGRPALGAELIQHDLLFSDGKQVGHTGGVCVVTDLATPEIACAVTFWLPDGTITTQFLTTPPPKKIFAITGGTGSYQQARGQGELVENGDGKTSAGGTGSLTFDVIG